MKKLGFYLIIDQFTIFNWSIIGEWQTWQWVVQQMHSLSQNLVLLIPLGRSHQTQLALTGWFYSQADEALYHYNSTEWSRHSQPPSQT